MNKYQYGYISSDDQTLSTKLIEKIGESIKLKAEIKAYVAKEVFNNINDFIEELKEKNKNKEELTDREYHLANSGFNVIVTHFVKNNIGAKVFMNGMAVSTKLTEEENEEIISSLLVKKRNGALGLRVKSPDEKIFLKNITIENNFIHDSEKNKVYVVKNNLIFKSENNSINSEIFQIFKDNVVQIGKRKNIDGIIYEKDGDIIKEDLAYGKIHDGLLKAKMISQSSVFLTKVDATFQEIIKRTEPEIKFEKNKKTFKIN